MLTEVEVPSVMLVNMKSELLIVAPLPPLVVLLFALLLFVLNLSMLILTRDSSTDAVFLCELWWLLPPEVLSSLFTVTVSRLKEDKEVWFKEDIEYLLKLLLLLDSLSDPLFAAPLLLVFVLVLIMLHRCCFLLLLLLIGLGLFIESSFCSKFQKLTNKKRRKE